jgi:DNA uptake protein ComE-like DNA-binding protein
MEKDVNAVTKQDLERHPALSSEQAKRIIDWRETRGSFNDVTELAEVPGIDETKAMQVATVFTVGTDVRRSSHNGDQGG